MLSFFLWFSENMATVSLFQFLDLYVATKVIKCLKTITKKLHVLSLVYWLLSDLVHACLFYLALIKLIENLLKLPIYYYQHI